MLKLDDMLKRYGFLGGLKLLFSYVYTKLFFPQARIIRLPFDIRNKQNIVIGKNFTTGFGCRIECFPLKHNDKIKRLVIGENVQMNDYVHIAASESVKIGNNVLMASKIFITDISHGDYSDTADELNFPSVPPNLRPLFAKPVEIGDNVWIGEFVSILPGVKIGKGSIIGANSVVTKDIPDNSIAVGIPARVVKKFDSIKLKWIPIK